MVAISVLLEAGQNKARRTSIAAGPISHFAPRSLRDVPRCYERAFQGACDGLVEGEAWLSEVCCFAGAA